MGLVIGYNCWLVLKQAVNYSRDILPVASGACPWYERGLIMDHIWIQSVQAVVIYRRRMQFGLGETSGILGVTVSCSYISY